MVVFALVFLAPIAYAIWLSLFREQVFFGGTEFVGLDNYAAVLGDAKFWESFLRVLLFLVVQVPIMLLLALVAALAIDSARLHAAGLFRIVIFLPYAVPGVVAALMWGVIYGDNFGLAADLNEWLGRRVVEPLSGDWILASIGNIVTWKFVGYGWEVLSLDLGTAPAVRDGVPADPVALGGFAAGPALLHGDFDLDEPSDLHLDTEGWGKGVAWVNGFALGRYWSRGPPAHAVRARSRVAEGPQRVDRLKTEVMTSTEARFVPEPSLGHTEQ